MGPPANTNSAVDIGFGNPYIGALLASGLHQKRSRLAKRRRKQLSVLVIPDDGSRTLEFKVSHWVLHVAAATLLCMLLLVVTGMVFFWQARAWERIAESLKRQNTRLRVEVERIDELTQVVGQIKHVNQQLRNMLSPSPDTDYASSGYGDDYGTAEDAVGQVVTVSGRPVTHLDEPLDPRQVPSIWPVSRSLGWITADFQETEGVLKARHLGIDIAAPKGATVYAAADGKVVLADTDEVLGQVVAIDHFGAFMTRYGHNAAILVSVGEDVRKGQPIALVGNTGRSSAPHLHYEVLEGGEHRNPRDYIPD
jgi:murein DD-endopeptidase MepM/ murein hydrolase activator NlpD